MDTPDMMNDLVISFRSNRQAFLENISLICEYGSSCDCSSYRENEPDGGCRYIDKSGYCNNGAVLTYFLKLSLQIISKKLTI